MVALWQNGRVPRTLLVDETDILRDYRSIVIAVPFRKRAIPIYWKLYKKDAGVCFLHFEKSGERWIKTYNTCRTKTYSLVSVIKRILQTTWDPDIFLDPYFTITDCAGQSP